MPATGWASGRDQQHRHEQVLHDRVAGEQPAEERRRPRPGPRPVTTPLSQPQRSIRWVTARVPGGVPGAEVAPGDRLRGDRHRVEGEGQEGPDGQGELHGGQVGVAEPRGGVRHHQQGGAQHQRAHDQRYAGPAGLADAGQVGSQRRRLAAGRPGPPPRPARPPSPTWASRVPSAEPAMPSPSSRHAVDEHQVEHDVGEVAGDGHHERRTRVLQPAEHPGGGQHQQQRHGAEQGDPQVGDRQVLDPGAGAEQPHQRPGQRAARAA